MLVIMSFSISFQSCITLTAKKQTLTFTSYPPGAKVYKVSDTNYEDVAKGYFNDYIGTTPFSYDTKSSVNGFAFVKDGYDTELIEAQRKGRWAAYLLGNLFWMPYGHMIDANKIYKYDKTSYHAVLSEASVPLVSQATSTISGINNQYIAPNAKIYIKPTYSSMNSRSELSAKKIFKAYNSAVFMIYGGDNYNVGQGSGFVINPGGLAISNYHNFSGMLAIGVKMYGKNKLYKLRKEDVLAYDEAEDYIIFQLPMAILSDFGKKQFDYIPVSQTRLEIGDKVIAIGSPRGLENTLSSGEVSQFRDYPYSIQINAPIDHGSSGGALINEYGEAVGITSAGRDDSGANLNFAIDLIRVLDKFK